MSCNQTKQTIKKGDENISRTETKPDVEELIADCWEGRKNINEVNTQRGNIAFIADNWMIAGDGFRYHPCKVEKEYQVEGAKVVVSGVLREIYSTERRAGTPFSMTAIEMVR